MFLQTPTPHTLGSRANNPTGQYSSVSGGDTRTASELITGELVVCSNLINFNQVSRPALDNSGAGFFIGIIAVNSSFSLAKESNFDIMKKKMKIVEKKAFLLNITLAFQMFTFYYYPS